MNKHLLDLITRLPQLSQVAPDIESAFNCLVNCAKSDGVIYTCGNGGSAADAEHIVGELVKGFTLQRRMTETQYEIIANLYPTRAREMRENLQRGIRAVSLVSNSALMTAAINDLDPDYVFAQQLFGLGKAGDVLIAISTSGNSQNVCNAARIASSMGIKVVSLTGESGGELKGLSTQNISVPSSNVALIQELHLPVYHCLCVMIEHELF